MPPLLAVCATGCLLVLLGTLLPGSDAFHYLQSNVIVDMYRRNSDINNKYACPKVRPFRHFELGSLMGGWYVIQYYASSEEAAEYSCMRCVFGMADGGIGSTREPVVMNFTYMFEDDPVKEPLQGNITWNIPDLGMPSHWVHAEDPYEGIYNTYVIDTDGKAWALIMHCAEKARTPRYLSALLLSREPKLGANVLNFLRDKLPRYDIDLSLMFNIDQTQCGSETSMTSSVAATMQSIGQKDAV